MYNNDLGNRDYRKGVLTGIYNKKNMSNPDWSGLANNGYAVMGYEYGFHNVEKARKELDDYNEWQQWQ